MYNPFGGLQFNSFRIDICELVTIDPVDGTGNYRTESTCPQLLIIKNITTLLDGEE